MVMCIRGEPAGSGDVATIHPVPKWTALTDLVRLLARRAAREATQQPSDLPPSSAGGEAP